jgi:hypothetical protein
MADVGGRLVHVKARRRPDSFEILPHFLRCSREGQ